MALVEVRPGDLITADDWNLLVKAVNDLERRLRLLETGNENPQGVVSITRLEPSRTRRLNDELRIIGRNFARGRGAARVFINEEPVPIEGGSTDELLIIRIPRSVTLGTATLRVTNSFTFATEALIILPELTPLVGDIVVTPGEVSPELIEPGVVRAYRFRFDIVSRTTRMADFVFNPVISRTAWQGSARVLDLGGVALPGRQLRIAPNQPPVGILAEFTLDPAPADRETFNLHLEATAEDRSWSLGDRDYTVNEAPIPTDPRIELSPPFIDPESAWDDTNNTIRLAPGGRASISYEVAFLAAGTYALVIDPASPVGGWIVEGSLTTDQRRTVTTAELAAANGRVAITAEILLTAPASGAPVGVRIGYRNIALTSRTVEPFTLRVS